MTKLIEVQGQRYGWRAALVLPAEYFEQSSNVTLTQTGLFTDADTFYGGVVSSAGGSQTVTQNTLYTDSDTFYAGSLRRAISAALYTDPDTFYTGSVGRRISASSLYTDADTFYGGSVGGATYTLTVDASEYTLTGRDLTATPVTPDYTLVVTQTEYTLTGRDLTVTDGGAYVPPDENTGAGRIRAEDAEREWEAKRKWRQLAKEYDFESKPEVVTPSVTPVPLDDLLPRLGDEVLSLSELIADARLLQLEQLQALEAAMAVRDVMRMAELAYLTELAVQQEKDAIAAFLMFMD